MGHFNGEHEIKKWSWANFRGVICWGEIECIRHCFRWNEKALNIYAHVLQLEVVPLGIFRDEDYMSLTFPMSREVGLIREIHPLSTTLRSDAYVYKLCACSCKGFCCTYKAVHILAICQTFGIRLSSLT